MKQARAMHVGGHGGGNEGGLAAARERNAKSSWLFLEESAQCKRPRL